MLVVVNEGQSLLDIAVQHAGAVEAVLIIAKSNGLSVTSTVAAGSTVEVPAVINTGVVRYFAGLPYAPATELEAGQELQGGIGYMIVGSTFKIG